jgi:hypothetical protein
MTGTIYLVASGQDGLLTEVARRAMTALGKPRPRIAVTYAPVEGDAAGLRFMSERMAGLFPGAELETLASDRAVVDRADLVFVSGGDPCLGAKTLASTGSAAWIRDASARGVPTMGVSAGAILLGDWWIDWGEEDGEGEATAEPTLLPCLGVAAGHVFDTHDEADGWQELHTAAGLLEARGIAAHVLGIPTRGALVLEALEAGGKPHLEVIGDPPMRLR